MNSKPFCLFLSLCLCSAIALASFVDEVEQVINRIAVIEPQKNVFEENRIRTHLENFYKTPCPPSENVPYYEYFTADARFNTAGRKGCHSLKYLAVGNEKGELPECEIKKFDIRDVQVHKDTAVAMVLAEADVGNKKDVQFVQVFELLKDPTYGWKIRISLLFGHVEFSDEVSNNHAQDQQDIENRILEINQATCQTDEAADLLKYTAPDIIINTGGKREHLGEEGMQQSIDDTHVGGCTIEEVKVVGVQVHGDVAIALALGTSTINGVEHPFIEALELHKTPSGKWLIDVSLVFVRLEIPAE